MTKIDLERENARLRAHLDELRAAAKEIWEAAQFYLQAHEIEELRDHLADQIAMFEVEKEVQS